MTHEMIPIQKRKTIDQDVAEEENLEWSNKSPAKETGVPTITVRDETGQ